MRRATSAGLVGGVAVVYLALVGMIEKFEVRHLVGDSVNLGKVLLALPPLLAAYLATRPRMAGGRLERPPPRAAVAAGLVSGVLTGGLTALGIALVHAFPDGAVRNIFISVSPALLSILTFGKSLAVGAVLLLLLGAVLGGLGAAYRVLPHAWQRPLSIGLAATFLFALLQRIIPPLLFNLNLDTSWLYSTSFGGLTVLGTVVVFAVSTGLLVLWSAKGKAVRERVQ